MACENKSTPVEFTLSKSQVDALFEQEAVLFGTNDGVPEYRIVEMFGEWVAAWIEKRMHDGCLTAGTDWNVWGAASEHLMIHYFYRSGFRKIVSEHNYRVSRRKHSTSGAGSVIDSVWKARCDRLAAAEAKGECKHKKQNTTPTCKK